MDQKIQLGKGQSFQQITLGKKDAACIKTEWISMLSSHNLQINTIWK